MWWDPDLEGYIHGRYGEGILAFQFLAFHYYRLTSDLLISHGNVDLEWTSRLLSQVNYSSSILKLVGFVTVTPVTRLFPPLTFVWFLFRSCRSENWCWGWRLPRCFKERIPIVAPGLNGREACLLQRCEWRSRKFRRACFVWGRLRTTDRGHCISSKGKIFSLLLLWVQLDSLAKNLVILFQTCELSRPSGTYFRAVASSLPFASPCPTSKLNSLWKLVGR